MCEKQPWEMTLSEWNTLSPEQLDGYWPEDPRERPLPYHTSFHRYEVAEALREGKFVPSKVLVDYPDLRRKYKPKHPAVPGSIEDKENAVALARRLSKAHGNEICVYFEQGVGYCVTPYNHPDTIAGKKGFVIRVV